MAHCADHQFIDALLQTYDETVRMVVLNKITFHLLVYNFLQQDVLSELS